MTKFTRGAVAGAAGTTALNAVGYADMALRGRPASPGLVLVCALAVSQACPEEAESKQARRLGPAGPRRELDRRPAQCRSW
jgi:hypothetical protein